MCMDTFGWQGTFLMVGGLFLEATVCGAVMRPVKRPKVPMRSQEVINISPERDNVSGLFNPSAHWYSLVHHRGSMRTDGLPGISCPYGHAVWYVGGDQDGDCVAVYHLWHCGHTSKTCCGINRGQTGKQQDLHVWYLCSPGRKSDFSYHFHEDVCTPNNIQCALQVIFRLPCISIF